MATSGSKSITPARLLTLKFSWNRTSVSDVNNTSTVSWKLQLITAAHASISSSKSKKWSVTVNGTKYSGTNTLGIGAGSTKTLASGSTVIAHNGDGTKTFSFSFSQEFGINFNGANIGTQSASGTGTLDTILRKALITAAPNFNDEDNPTINYTNPLGNRATKVEVCISLAGSAADIPYREVSKTGTSYTFNLTAAERQTLRNATVTSTARTVYFFIQTTINGSIIRHSVPRQLTIINCTPTVTGTVKDINQNAVALTGDESKFIKGYSIAQIDISAQPKKGATINGYAAYLDNKVVAVTASSTIQGVSSANFKLGASDSRGLWGYYTPSLTLIDYTTLTCGLDCGIPSAEGSVSLSITGNYFNGSFGAVSNTLTVQYRYKADDGAYVSWITATPTISGNTYSAQFDVTGLDYQKAYTFQARAVDEVITDGILSAEVKIKTSPIFDWSATDFNFNVPIYYKGNTKLCYEAGDTITFGNYDACWAGFVTSGGKEATFTIPLSKPILATAATVDGTVICRCNGNYLDSSSGISIPNSTKFSCDTKISETGIYVHLSYKAAIPNAQNNGAFVAVPSGSFSITLS